MRIRMPMKQGSLRPRMTARLEAPAPTVGEDDTEQRGARGNKHGGPPGQLAKELLGDRSQRSLLGTLVSLIAQGQFEEAQRLVNELTAEDDDGAGAARADTTAEPSGETTATRQNGEGSGKGSGGGSHGGSRGGSGSGRVRGSGSGRRHGSGSGSGSGSGDNAFFSDYLNGGISGDPTPAPASSLSVENLTWPNGTITDNGDGTYTFTPNENFNGEAALSYSVSDGQASVDAAATVTIAPANTAPTVSAPIDLGHLGVEDEPLLITALALLETASDLDGDTLSVENLSSPNGTIEDNGDGTFTFTPNENFNGEAALNYTVSDGTESVETTASVTFHAVNDAPVVSGPVDLGQLGVEGQPFIITLAALLATATDVDDEDPGGPSTQIPKGTSDGLIDVLAPDPIT